MRLAEDGDVGKKRKEGVKKKRKNRKSSGEKREFKVSQKNNEEKRS